MLVKRMSYFKALRSLAKNGATIKETLTKKEEIYNKSKSARITKKNRSKDDNRDSEETIEMHLVEELIIVVVALDMIIDKTPDVVTIQDAIEIFLSAEAAGVIQVAGEIPEEIDSSSL